MVILIGIGHVSTMWVGQQGKAGILTEFKANKHFLELKELKLEVLKLATECKQALLPHATVTPTNEPVDHQVMKAISMCNKYLLKQSEVKDLEVNLSLKSLWETKEPEENKPVRVHGEELVNVITEKNRQPPDVSVNIPCRTLII